jgi:acyl dehydratase
MAERKPASELGAGEELEPFEFVVTPELNQQYLYAEEDFHPRYWNETHAGPPIVHPSLLLNLSNHTRSPSFFLPPGWAGIHGADETSFLRPARVGERLKVTWRVIDAYEKRGKPYQKIEIRVVDEDGLAILRRIYEGTYASPAVTKYKG